MLFRSNAKEVLETLTPMLEKRDLSDWCKEFDELNEIENQKVIIPEISPVEGALNMGEVVAKVSELTNNDAIIVTDVGQNQMMAARYSKFNNSRSFVSSGGLGTMGYGLPAAIGAKIAAPNRPVCFFTGDGGIQMTIQELGTILQEKTGVKIIILNNSWLGMVRPWQELFFEERYAETSMRNPEFIKLASAYGIKGRKVEKREDLDDAIKEMLSDNEPFLLEVNVVEKGMVFPMIPGGKCVDKMMLTTTEWH